LAHATHAPMYKRHLHFPGSTSWLPKVPFHRVDRIIATPSSWWVAYGGGGGMIFSSTVFFL